MNNLKLYSLTILSSLLITLGIFNVFGINLLKPLNYSGDAIVHYNFAQNIEDTNNWAINPRFGAPLSQTLYDFPLTENFQLLIIKILIFIGFNWIQSINAYYLLTFPLVTAAAVYVFKKFQINDFIAITLGLIYTFVPYHFLRGINHLFLSGYFVVPIAVYASYKIAINKPLAGYKLILSSLLIASCGAYYTFFSLYFLFVAGIYSLLKKFEKKLLVAWAKTLALVIFLFFINYLPTFIYTVKNGQNYNTTVRMANETELYGLKIAQLVLPFEDHSLTIFNKLQKRYLQNGSLTTTENQYAALGVVTSIGFLLLLIFSLFKPSFPKIEKKLGQQLEILGLFNLLALLLGTIGGFATIISTYINPTFRSVNRVSIFIAFISVLGLGILAKNVRFKYMPFVVWLILLFALYDQVSIGVMRNFMRDTTKYDQLVVYTADLQKTAGNDAKIFTLPVGEYPEGNDKDIMRIALLTKNIKWSTGAEKLRAINMWQRSIENLDAKQLLEKIIAEGFTGLVIKIDGIDNMKWVALQNEIGAKPLVDSVNHYAYYDLREYAITNNLANKPSQIYSYISGNCLYDYEKKYYCVNKGRLELINTTDQPINKDIEYTIETADGNTSRINEQLIIEPGVSHKYLTTNVKNVFQIPTTVPVWPLNLGYPNFIISNLEIK